MTPTDSRVHHCGKKDVETSKSAEDVEGHEDDVHETATQEEVKQEGSQAPTQRGVQATCYFLKSRSD